MRVSRLYKKEDDVPAEVIPAARVALWTVIGLVILAGIALYFRYERFMSPLI